MMRRTMIRGRIQTNIVLILGTIVTIISLLIYGFNLIVKDVEEYNKRYEAWSEKCKASGGIPIKLDRNDVCFAKPLIIELK